MTFIFLGVQDLAFPFTKPLDHFRSSPLPAPGRGVPSLRGGVREHDGVPNIICPLPDNRADVDIGDFA